MCEIIAIIEPPQEIVAVVEAVTVEVASLNEIELLQAKEDDKQSQLLKVVIPATLGKYTETFTQTEVPLPEEFRNAICIEYFEYDGGSSVTLLNTEKTLSKPIGDVEQVYYIKKLIGIEEFKSADVKVATISQEELAK